MHNYYRDVTKFIRKNSSCKKIRPGKGSHETWQNLDTGVKFTIPKKIKSRHTANGCLKDASIEKNSN